MKRFLSVLILLCMALTLIPFAHAESTDPYITTDRYVYAENEPIMITAGCTNPTGNEWVGIWTKEKLEGSVYWEYLSVAGNGVTKDVKSYRWKKEPLSAYFDLPAGEYRVSLIRYDSSNDGLYDMLATKDIVITDDSSPYITSDKTIYAEGEPILVTAGQPNPAGSEWVGLWTKEKLEGSVYWEYLSTIGSGVTKNVKNFSAKKETLSAYFDLPAGEYRISLIRYDSSADGLHDMLATKDITIMANPDTAPAAPVAATYTLDNATDGMADGTLSITLPQNNNATDIYMWWGNANGKLSGYTRLAKFKTEGKTTVTRRMTPDTIIPTDATKLMVYTANDSGLSATCYEIALPQNSAFKDPGKPLVEFQVISDTHVDGLNTTYSNNVKSMFSDIVANSPESTGIYIVGDLVHRGYNQTHWSAYNQIIASYGDDLPPIYTAIGNHEFMNDASGLDYATAFQYYAQNSTLPDGSHPQKVYYDFWMNDYHYVVLGQTNNNPHNGTLGTEQLNWLRETLASHRTGKPIFLMLHIPIPNTLPGTNEQQGNWATLSDHAELKAILDQYPEVLMFSGHTHWTMNTPNSMVDGEGETATLFNTASASYLWDSYTVQYGERLDGSQGYYVRVYEDKVMVLGRDFQTNEWIPSAAFVTKTLDLDVEETEHTYTVTESKQPTATAEGYELHTCSLCGHQKTVVLPVLVDLNGDSKADSADVIFLLKYLNNKNFTLPATADLNGDGAISLADVIRLLKLITS